LTVENLKRSKLLDVFEEAKQLSRVPLFSKLDASKLKLIAFTSEQQKLSDGDYLFHFNEPSDSIYLILEGTLEVVAEHEDGRVDVIVKRERNEIIGEMGVISNAPRSATIRAGGPATVLRIEADAFMNLLSENPSMSLYVMRELSDRLNKSHLREVKILEQEPRH